MTLAALTSNIETNSTGGGGGGVGSFGNTEISLWEDPAVTGNPIENKVLLFYSGDQVMYF